MSGIFPLGLVAFIRNKRQPQLVRSSEKQHGFYLQMGIQIRHSLQAESYKEVRYLYFLKLRSNIAHKLFLDVM